MSVEMTLCQDVPPINHTNVDRHSVCTSPADGPYAASISFEAHGRTFYLMDKDDDGIIDFIFSFGAGPEWCVDHSAIPLTVAAWIEKIAHPLTLEIPHELRAAFRPEPDGDG